MASTNEDAHPAADGGPVLTRQTIVNRLKERDVTERMKAEVVLQFARQRKGASVLVPLILCKNGEVQILLTVRARHLRTDAGDVAFPGGKQDEEDEDENATALREAWEEIGLHQTDVEVVSQLAPMVSRSGYFITPVAGLIPETFEPNVNPNEVEDVFRVPLIDFLRHDHHESRQLPKNVGRFSRIHFFTHTKDDKTYVTYGLTAYLCILAACTVFGRVPDYDMEPEFDPANSAEAVIDHIERENIQQMTSSSKM